MKQFIIIFITCCISISTYGRTVKVSSASAFTTAFQQSNNNDIIQLTADLVDFNSALKLPGKTITIDLAGHTISRNTTGDVIQVSGGGTVNIISSNGRGVIQNTHY